MPEYDTEDRELNAAIAAGYFVCYTAADIAAAEAGEIDAKLRILVPEDIVPRFEG